MSEAASSLVGQILAGTYRVEKLLGKGGMGAVYGAAHLRLPTRVAIKVLHAEAAGNPEIFARFRREAEISSGLRHPNIVQVLDFNNLPEGAPYLVMEYLDGEDLHARLRQRGRLTFAEAVSLCRAISGGLSAAHKREVVHRDLKPQNIFLARHEQGDEVVEIPKIVDFGISKIRHAVTDSLKTQDQQLLGTPNYMSPEQARGLNSEVDHRTDQWALAAILYQCLAGRLAFGGDTLAAIIYQVVLAEPPTLRGVVPDLTEPAEQALRRAMSKNRDERFPNIMEFARAFCGQGAGAFAPSAGSTPAGEHLGALTPEQRPAVTPPPSEAPALPSGSIGSLTGAGGQVTNAPAYGRRRVLLGLLGGAVGVAAVMIGWFALRGPGPSVAIRQDLGSHAVAAPADLGHQAPVVEEVTVQVRVSPKDAAVLVGEHRLPPEGQLKLPRGGAEVEVVASAPGYSTERISFIPSSDQRLDLNLEPLPTGRHERRERPDGGGRRGRGSRTRNPESDAEDVDLSGIK